MKDEERLCIARYAGFVPNSGCQWQCDCGYYEVVETHTEAINGGYEDIPYEPPMFEYTYCKNCGGKIVNGGEKKWIKRLNI